MKAMSYILEGAELIRESLSKNFSHITLKVQKKKKGKVPKKSKWPHTELSNLLLKTTLVKMREVA